MADDFVVRRVLYFYENYIRLGEMLDELSIEHNRRRRHSIECVKRQVKTNFFELYLQRLVAYQRGDAVQELMVDEEAIAVQEDVGEVEGSFLICFTKSS
jgi:hypothetical protein